MLARRREAPATKCQIVRDPSPPHWRQESAGQRAATAQNPETFVMTNASLKSALGWLIVGGQLALLLLVFVLEMKGRFDPPERKAAFAAVIPTVGVYFAAAVIHFMAGPSVKSKWASQNAPVSRVMITFLLPGLLWLALAGIFVSNAVGTFMSSEAFTDYLGLLQAAQAFVATVIYGYYFRRETGTWKRERPAQSR